MRRADTTVFRAFWPAAGGHAAVADEPDRLVVPLDVEVVEGVLEGGVEAEVVLGSARSRRRRRGRPSPPGEGVRPGVPAGRWGGSARRAAGRPTRPVHQLHGERPVGRGRRLEPRATGSPRGPGRVLATMICRVGAGSQGAPTIGGDWCSCQSTIAPVPGATRRADGGPPVRLPGTASSRTGSILWRRSGPPPGPVPPSTTVQSSQRGIHHGPARHRRSSPHADREAQRVVLGASTPPSCWAGPGRAREEGRDRPRPRRADRRRLCDPGRRAGLERHPHGLAAARACPTRRRPPRSTASADRPSRPTTSSPT